jgi:amino-acid N-acetyltransferase
VTRDDTMDLFPGLPDRPRAFSLLDPLPQSRSLLRIWEVLARRRFCVGVVPGDAQPIAEYARFLAQRLRIHKVVLVEAEGGVKDPRGQMLSFMDLSMLDALLRPGEAEHAGVGHRRPTFEAIHAALDAGVPAVNLCSLDGLARELFTYEGSGTLFTEADYCRVEPLGIDDVEEVELLIERGQREGFLKPRAAAEIAQIVLHGYGATIGGHHLAGICGLYTEPYEQDCAGEIVALYTMTRFKGEGVGQKLLAYVEGEARRRNLRYLFACTSAERAQSFFLRRGFHAVTPEEVPAAKWKGYDVRRRKQVAVYRRDLEPEGAKP